MTIEISDEENNNYNNINHNNNDAVVIDVSDHSSNNNMLIDLSGDNNNDITIYPNSNKVNKLIDLSNEIIKSNDQIILVNDNSREEVIKSANIEIIDTYNDFVSKVDTVNATAAALSALETTNCEVKTCEVIKNYSGTAEATSLVNLNVVGAEIDLTNDKSMDESKNQVLEHFDPIITVIGNPSYPNGEVSVRLSEARRLSDDPNFILSNTDRFMNDTLQHFFDTIKYEKLSKRHQDIILFMAWFFYSCIKLGSDNIVTPIAISNYEVLIKGKKQKDLKQFFDSALIVFDIFLHNHISFGGVMHLRSLLKVDFLQCEVIMCIYP